MLDPRWHWLISPTLAAGIGLATVAVTYLGFAIVPPSLPPPGSTSGEAIPWTSEGVAYAFWVPGLGIAACLYVIAILRAAWCHWCTKPVTFGASVIAHCALFALAVVSVHSDVVVIHVFSVQIFMGTSVVAFVAIRWHTVRAGESVRALNIVLALLAALLGILAKTLVDGFGSIDFYVARLEANRLLRILEGPLIAVIAIGWLIVARHFDSGQPDSRTTRT